MYYIYEHKTLTGEIFYIGKGTINKKNSYGGYARAYSKSKKSKKIYLDI